MTSELQILAFMVTVSEKITKYGHAVVGVAAEERENGAPTYSYTVGLHAHWGSELIVFGLDHMVAQTILNDVAKAIQFGEPPKLGEPDTRFANLPVKFMECDERAQAFNGVARKYYGYDALNMTQIVLCDREGRFPEDADFDNAYMSRCQKLLYRRTLTRTHPRLVRKDSHQNWEVVDTFQFDASAGLPANSRLRVHTFKNQYKGIQTIATVHSAEGGFETHRHKDFMVLLETTYERCTQKNVEAQHEKAITDSGGFDSIAELAIRRQKEV